MEVSVRNTERYSGQPFPSTSKFVVKFLLFFVFFENYPDVNTHLTW